MGKQWATTSLAALIVILFVSIFALFNLESRDLVQLVDAYRQHHEKYVIATRMRNSTNDLTRLARTYAMTGDEKFHRQYLELLKTRNGELPEPANYDWIYWDYLAVDGQPPPSELTYPISYDEVIRRGDLNTHEQELLSQARKKSDELAVFEQSVFAEGTWPTGSTSALQLFDPKYHSDKLEILSRVNVVFQSLDHRAKARIQTLQAEYEKKQLIQVVLFGALLLASAAWIAHTYRANKTAISDLDRKVAERTSSLNESNRQLEVALKEIKTLEGLLPICSYCHSVRDDDGNWSRIEDYISSRSEARFTHGMCPTCYERERSKIRPGTV
ncbi:MAG: hypothetical protein AB7U75_04410 [Hyphomicrobiaceae bacterium]